MRVFKVNDNIKIVGTFDEGIEAVFNEIKYLSCLVCGGKGGEKFIHDKNLSFVLRQGEGESMVFEVLTSDSPIREEFTNLVSIKHEYCSELRFRDYYDKDIASISW